MRDGEPGPTIKCVVWDLDDTLWEGVLLEEAVSPKPSAREVVETLDGRGILQSIASRNDRDAAIERLEAFGLAEYFLAPEIHWGTKSASLKRIADVLNLGLDAFAFVDDDPFERAEVHHSHPEVLCIDGAAPLTGFLELPRMKPRFAAVVSRRRRLLYREDFARREAEESFEGSTREFLATVGMHLTIAPARENDLRRAEELTERTHQLNSTGQTYSYDRLARLLRSSDHLLLVAALRDRFGEYGSIGLALVERGAPYWTLKLLIVSCRVISRGVGGVLLGDVMARARSAGSHLRAEFRDTGRNRVMRVMYRFAGFEPIEERDGLTIFEHDLARVPSVPDYLDLTSVDDPVDRPAAAG